MSRANICVASPRRVDVVVRRQPTDRTTVKGVSARFRVRVTVVSDYLFIGSGRMLVDRKALERIAKQLANIDSVDQLLRFASSLRGFGRVKEFYHTGGRPAIPGSSLKGAARSRIELGSAGKRVPSTFLYDTGVLQSLPRVGQHGWRHARIWCESVFEERLRGSGYTVLEDVMGVAGRGIESLGSRVYFGTLLLASDHEPEIVSLDHGETLQAMPRGSVFEGEILVHNLELDELGLVFYGLAQDKPLYCNREPLMLLGASKYRCRTRARNGKPVEFGVVRVDVVDVMYAPWSRVSGLSVRELVEKALEASFNSYGLRKCFDEVGRRRLVEPCRS